MRGLIFDFDGVIADSEMLVHVVLGEILAGFGCHSTLDELMDRYIGKRWPEVLAQIERDIGTVPDDFAVTLKAATLARFRTDLQEVTGARAFISAHAHHPRCIASSSPPDRLQVCLEVLGLLEEFGGKVFSADMVERGKPHPDIFLLAAERIGVPPSRCIVIEDSPSGARAGMAAGMTVIGLCAASHLRSGHCERLAAAGASYTADSWSEVEELFSRLRLNE